MIEEILSKINFISPIFYQVLYMSVIGSIVGLLIYFLRNIFDKKISGKWKCIMWCIVLVTLIVPIRFEIKTDSKIVIQNEIVDKIEDIKNISNYDYKVERKIENNKDFQSIKENQETNNNLIIDSLKNDLEQSNNINIKDIIINLIIPCIWIFGILVFIATFISGSKRISKRISKHIYKDERTENILIMCKNQLNIKKKINIVIQNYKKVPSIFGILNPVVLITEKTLEEDNQTIKYIFLHELSHYKRKDLIFNYILLCVLSIHWFNPVVWFLFKKIRQDIEIGADELATKKLDKNEKKEYGMVLINLLRNSAEENYTASMLCMSDTGKNMERRIHMIKKKSSSILISVLLVLIVAGTIIGFVFIKFTNSLEVFSDMKPIENTVKEQEALEDYYNETQNNTIKSFSEENRIESNTISNEENNITNSREITSEERAEIEEYVNKMCNWRHGELPEFKDINSVDKKWIYSHLEPRIRTNIYSYSTKEEIEEDLKKIFGEDLIFDVERDIRQNPDAFWPHYNNEDGKYSFPHFGMEMSTYYAIDNIKKDNNNYVINLIEYFESDDFFQVYSNNLGDYTVVYNYQTRNDVNNHTGVFYIETSKLDNSSSNHYISDKILNKEVLKRKDQFRSFDITITKNDDGKMYITESKLVRSN